MPGTIVFKPIEANIISKDKDVLGKMDPYLSFHLGGLKRVKGEVAKSGGQHPVWNDAITVEVADQTSLTVDLKDKDMLIDDKIASFEVDLREVQSQGRVRKWYPIFRKSEPAGEVLMEATFSGGQFGTGFNQGQQYAGAGGLQQGQSQYSGSQYSAIPFGTLQQGQSGTTGLNQGQYGTGLSQGQGQYGTGLSQGQGQYGTGLSQGQGQYGTGLGSNIISQTSTSYKSSGLQQGTQYSGTQYGSVPLGGLQQGTQYGGLQQGSLPQTQYGGLQQGQYGGLPQSQYGGLQSGQFGGLQQGQGYGSQPTSEQFAKEALLRGSDPLNTQQNYYYNQGQGGYGMGAHQNLTQTPSFSGTDPLLYEGDKNRFSNPPQQVPYGAKNVQEYGHKHKHGANPTTNPNVNPNVNNPNPGYY